MKKIAIVVIFLLLVLGVILFAFLRPKSSSTEQLPATETVGSMVQDPEQFAGYFYEWYLLNSSRNEFFPYSEDAQEALGEWLTAEFAASWDEQVTNSNGMDPVLLTDDITQLLKSSVTANLMSSSGQSAVVTVTLSDGVISQTYDVGLAKDRSGTWRVSSVIPGR